MTPVDLDGRAREALVAAWAARRPGRARQVLLAARAGQAIVADIARLPGARAAGDVVLAVVSAEYAARVLDLGFGWQGGEVRESDPARVLVVLVSDEDAAVAHLDEARGGAERGAGEEEPVAMTTSAAAASAPEDLEADTGARELRAEVLEVFAEAQGHAHEDAMEAWAARRRERCRKRPGQERKGRAMATTKKTTHALQPTQRPALEAPPERPAKKKVKKRPNRKKFGHGQYGTGTKRTVAETREQIESLLAKYGCDRFGFVNDATTNKTTVQFRCQSRTIRFVLALPDMQELAELPARRGKPSTELVKKRHDKALRGRWRALYAAIKAKLVLVQYRIESFEEAFIGETVDEESGLTVNELIQHRRVLPRLATPNTTALPMVVNA